jgi:hypothetical protein
MKVAEEEERGDAGEKYFKATVINDRTLTITCTHIHKSISPWEMHKIHNIFQYFSFFMFTLLIS